jgi:SSS family solute:Na+ symporter/sodium/proline symporter
MINRNYIDPAGGDRMAVRIIILGLYALTIIFFGIRGMRKTKTFSDFLLGGGKIGPWMTAFSYGTAYFSAVVFIGFAGKVGWGFGYSGVWIGVSNALVGVLGVWGLMAWKIKKMSRELGVTTMSEYLEVRYKSRGIKLFSSIIIFIFLIPYSGAVFIGLSYLFEYSFQGIEYWHAVVFMGVFTAVYLVMGGYKSMAVIDMFFGMVMTVGVIMLLFFTLSGAGGIGNITRGLSEINPKLTGIVGPPGIWPLFSLVFLTSVAPFAMPQLIQKFYAIRDKESVRTGMVVSTVFALLVGGIAYFVGSTTQYYINPETAPAVFQSGSLNVDALMPALMGIVIPDYLFIIILVLILSASMSTLASLVLISSSSLVKDIYAGFINKNISDRSLTGLMRLGSVFFIILSVIIALIKPATIVSILGVSWGAIGSAFLGPFVWGLFTTFTNKYGAWASAIFGLGVTISMYVYGFSSPEAGTVGMLLSLTINPIVSLLTQKAGRS